MKKSKIYISFVLLCLFIINTILVINNSYTKIDNAVHSFLIGFYSETTTNIMNVFTVIGKTLPTILICAGIFFIFLFKKKKIHAFCTAGLLAISTIVNNVIKIIIRRPRPTEMVMVVEKTFSYPSGHMMACTTLYGFLIYLLLQSKLPKFEKILFTILLCFIVLMIGTSRIYLGAHYFSDVLGGLICSSLIISIFAMFDDAKHIIKKAK